VIVGFSMDENDKLVFADHDESLPWLNLDHENGELLIGEGVAYHLSKLAIIY